MDKSSIGVFMFNLNRETRPFPKLRLNRAEENERDKEYRKPADAFTVQGFLQAFPAGRRNERIGTVCRIRKMKNGLRNKP